MLFVFVKVRYRAVELPATARMLTLLALYHAYAYSDDTAAGDSYEAAGDDGVDAGGAAADAFLLQFFGKAHAVAGLLLARRAASAARYGGSDPRHGIPYGGDEARDGADAATILHAASPQHWYASAAELYRACAELGATWSAIGARAGRADVAAHGAELLALAPQLRTDLHASLNRTLRTSGGGGGGGGSGGGMTQRRCWQLTAEAGLGNASSTPAAAAGAAAASASFRGYAEMMFSGALTAEQIGDIYTAASGGSAACGAVRFLTLGSPGLADAPGQASLSSPTSYGFGYGLLQADHVERFLLHYFAVSAHGYTRGTFTTPESANLADRDEPAIAYAAAGVVLAPTYLKWMLVFEDVETRELWLGKATPRGWLAAGEAPLVVERATTRWGRVSFSMSASNSSSSSSSSSGGGGGGAYTVSANVSLPAGAAASAPAAPAFAMGGLRLRIRAPPPHSGQLSSVSVGGKPWARFNPIAETVDFSAEDLTPELLADLQAVVATFSP